ncbi:serine/threonine-protein kinase [Amedibacillus dolichus]|uniref:Serine/threonine-protein kinase n=1 Tax=Amedibacillus dolichus TaxID=31971 RepID=A0ABT7UBM3_9FIRM|nr:serine/threonine-protein kinase [Amedibacillus dolichus]MDM8157036.1 serine/threonine-protein kinase [Amedibacillus dolichus]
MAVIGQVIDGKYEILKLIGKGGMSKVYLAMDRRLNKQWAIKEIVKNALDENNKIVVHSAIAEANLIKQLDHPAIVRIVDIIDNEDVIYIIEDYIEGETLNTVLEQNGAQPQEIVIEWAIQICEALEYLHTRNPPIIYRDMKPANVMLKPEGNIKIIDFGIAREYKDEKNFDTVNLGTKGYAAPEQFGGKGQSDARTDIYCLGVTLYHLVTGHNPSEPPYELYPIRYWNPQLSAGLEVIIQKCTQLNPSDRYQNCAELLYALHHYEEYGAAYREKQKRKLRLFGSVVGMSLVCLLVGISAMIIRVQIDQADYSQNIAMAEKASTTQGKLDYYARAADIRPTAFDAYYGMIDAVKTDASFSLEEEQAITRKLNLNLNALRQEDGYADLAFEMGKLYWYYYDYGAEATEDNQLTRMKSAIGWFDDAVSYGSQTDDFYTMATIYRDIGIFNRDITLHIEEAADKGDYAPYWENIKQLVDKIAFSDESEIIQLEVYRLAMYSMETYARKFKADGISQQEMTKLYETVVNATDQVVTTSDKTEQLKQEVSLRYDAAGRAIEDAYREQVKKQ